MLQAVTALVGAALLLRLAAPVPAHAQQPMQPMQQEEQLQPGMAGEKPVMENVFFNVVWGSAVGALTGAAISVAGSKDKTRPNNFRQSVFQGATLGGLTGVGIGLWLVYSGITFDQQATILSGEPGQRRAVVQRRPAAPLTLETSTAGALRITGFRARVLHLNF